MNRVLIGLSFFIVISLASEAFSYEERELPARLARDTAKDKNIEEPASPRKPKIKPWMYDDPDREKADKSSPPTDDDSNEDDGFSSWSPEPFDINRLSFQLGAGFGGDAFSAKGTVGYPLYQLLRIDVYADYFRSHTADRTWFVWGPGVDFVVHYRLIKILEPFVGLGLSYNFWENKQRQQLVEKSSTSVGHYFFGGNVYLTKYFGLMVERRARYFSQMSPPAGDGSSRTGNPDFSTRAGFFVRINL